METDADFHFAQIPFFLEAPKIVEQLWSSCGAVVEVPLEVPLELLWSSCGALRAGSRIYGRFSGATLEQFWRYLWSSSGAFFRQFGIMISILSAFSIFLISFHFEPSLYLPFFTFLTRHY